MLIIVVRIYSVIDTEGSVQRNMCHSKNVLNSLTKEILVMDSNRVLSLLGAPQIYTKEITRGIKPLYADGVNGDTHKV